MSVSLAQRHADCWQAFASSCNSASGSTGNHESLLEEFDKYKLWAGNVGAAHSGKTYQLSLDYRLREAPFYKEQVSKLLGILTRQVGKIAEILRGARVPFEEASSDSESGDDSEISNMEEDSPWEISSDSEAETSDNPNQHKPPTPPMPRHSSSEDLLEGLPPGETGTAKSPPITELSQLLESIRVTVTCLYKLPLRKPASIDRLGDETTEDVICFQPFDLHYVQDKFPKLDPEVAARFAKMITRRRQLLLYRKRHRDKLRTEATVPAARATDPGKHSDDPTLQSRLQTHIFKEQENRPAANAPSLRESNSNTVKTKASTFKMDGIPQIGADELLAPSIAQSDSKTSIVVSEATRDIRVQVPPRPQTQEGFDMARFECKYCCLTAHVRSDKNWKKHVLNDLQPYVCTYPKCSHSNHPFGDQDAWYRHEAQFHRYDWFCNNPDHAPYSSAFEFKHHMKRMHQEEYDAAMPLDIFRQPQPLSGVCNLCSRKTDNLKRHVSRHLQQVALFALPRADYAADDEDLQEGDSDAAQYRAKGSQLSELGGSASQISEEQSTPSVFGDDVNPDGAVEGLDTPFDLADDPLQASIPDADETDWDLLTDKFSMAREGNADIAPIIPQRTGLKFKSVGIVVVACLRLVKLLDVAAKPAKQPLEFIPNHPRAQLVMLDFSTPGSFGRSDSKITHITQFFSNRLFYDVHTFRAGHRGISGPTADAHGHLEADGLRKTFMILYITKQIYSLQDAKALVKECMRATEGNPNVPGLMIFDLQTEQEDLLREITPQELFAEHHARQRWQILCGLGDSKVSEYAGESASFHRALVSTLDTFFSHSAKPRSVLELRDALNQRREDMGAYGYVAELVYPRKSRRDLEMVYLYPLVKKKFRRVSFYRRIGIMLFWVELEGRKRFFTSQRVLEQNLRNSRYYELHETKLRTASPLFPQLIKFLDGFFKRFNEPDNLMIICFEGSLGMIFSTNTALYKSFLDVVQDYLKEPKADSFIMLHANETCQSELDLHINSASPHKRLLPHSEILICTAPQISVGDMLKICLRYEVKTAQFMGDLLLDTIGMDSLNLSRFPSVGKISSNIPWPPLVPQLPDVLRRR